MSPSPTEQRKVCERSGSRCAFENCRQVLTTIDPVSGEVVTLGNIAHIVAKSFDGPRGDDPMPIPERDRHPNLMLLCTAHHQLIDSRESELTYPKERLLAMKETHEERVEKRLGEPGFTTPEPPMVTNEIVATAFPVERMARYLYTAESPARRPHDVVVDHHGPEMTPFTLHDGRLWAFQDLRSPSSPFARSLDRASTERLEVAELAANEDYHRVLVDLLNRCLNKLTGRLGLAYNRRPRRFYFPTEPENDCRSVPYDAPPSGRKQPLAIAWRPIRKATGEPRPYWLHRAVGLGWVDIGDNQWILTVRPELHVTENGTDPYDNAKVGAIVTRWKSSIYNKELWRELSFWRQQLSGKHPRIVFKFSDSEAIHLTASFVESTITWPGLPEESATYFDNTDYEETLLTTIDAMLDAADDLDYDGYDVDHLDDDDDD